MKSNLKNIKLSMTTEPYYKCTVLNQATLYDAIIADKSLTIKENNYLITEMQNLGERKNPEISQINCMIFDIDNGMTPFEFIQKYNYECYIAPSFNWNTKGSFRVIIPIDQDLEVNVKLYMLAKCSIIPDQDTNCRMFYYAPYLNTDICPNIMKHEGELFSALDLYIIINDIKLKKENEIKKQSILNNNNNKYGDTLSSKYLQACVDTINNAKKGERDTTIFKTLSVLKDKNATQQNFETIYQGIMDENKRQMFRDKLKRIINK